MRLGSILVADAEPVVADDMAAWTVGKCLVTRAKTLREAKLRIIETEPSFIVTEAFFSDGDGLDLVDFAARVLPTARIVLHSRYADLRVAVSAVKLGAADVVPKPTDAAFLLRLLVGDAEFPECAAEHIPEPDRIRDDHIRYVYRTCGYNVSQTARLLTLHRRSLQRYLGRHPA